MGNLWSRLKTQVINSVPEHRCDYYQPPESEPATRTPENWDIDSDTTMDSADNYHSPAGFGTASTSSQIVPQLQTVQRACDQDIRTGLELFANNIHNDQWHMEEELNQNVVDLIKRAARLVNLRVARRRRHKKPTHHSEHPDNRDLLTVRTSGRSVRRPRRYGNPCLYC